MEYFESQIIMIGDNIDIWFEQITEEKDGFVIKDKKGNVLEKYIKTNDDV